MYSYLLVKKWGNGTYIHFLAFPKINTRKINQGIEFTKVCVRESESMFNVVSVAKLFDCYLLNN